MTVNQRVNGAVLNLIVFGLAVAFLWLTVGPLTRAFMSLIGDTDP